MRYFEETVSAGASAPRRSRVLNVYGSSIFPPLRFASSKSDFTASRTMSDAFSRQRTANSSRLRANHFPR